VNLNLDANARPMKMLVALLLAVNMQTALEW